MSDQIAGEAKRADHRRLPRQTSSEVGRSRGNRRATRRLCGGGQPDRDKAGGGQAQRRKPEASRRRCVEKAPSSTHDVLTGVAISRRMTHPPWEDSTAREPRSGPTYCTAQAMLVS